MIAVAPAPVTRVLYRGAGYVLVENLEVGVYFGEDDLEVLADVILPPVVAGPSLRGVEIIIRAVRTFPGGLRVDPIDWTEEQRDHVESELVDEALRVSWEEAHS